MGFMHWTQGEKAVKRLMALWNMFAEKIHWGAFLRREKKERKKRSLVVAPPSFPEIPHIKERPKDRYTVLVLAESGNAKQLALSKSRLKIIAAFSAAILLFLVVLAVGVVKYFPRQRAATVASVTVATQPVVSANQPTGGINQITTATATSGDPVSPPASTSVQPQELKQEGTGSSPVEESAAPAKIVDQKPVKAITGDQPGRLSSADNPSGSSNTSHPQGASPSHTSPEPFLMNFDAQQVTATLEAPNNGTLSFRLVKDQPDIKFAGYLFVYVEMEDQRGENRIYVYPKQTRLGEGDLPYDFRDGETIAFKFNSRVELPYGDPRPSASLSAVSILLYGENGKIVFQRSFGGQEVATANPKANKAEQTKPRGSGKRQAL